MHLIKSGACACAHIENESPQKRRPKKVWGKRPKRGKRFSPEWDAPVRGGSGGCPPLRVPSLSPHSGGMSQGRRPEVIGLSARALQDEPESVSSKRGNTNRKGEDTAYFPESKLPAKGSLWNRRKFLFPRNKSEGKRKAEISNPGISRVVRPILTDHGSEGLLIFLRGDRQGQATTLFE